MFFSFPHIGIDSKGAVGNISRPGRAGMSCACGAVIKVRANWPAYFAGHGWCLCRQLLSTLFHKHACGGALWVQQGAVRNDMLPADQQMCNMMIVSSRTLLQLLDFRPLETSSLRD